MLSVTNWNAVVAQALAPHGIQLEDEHYGILEYPGFAAVCAHLSQPDRLYVCVYCVTMNARLADRVAMRPPGALTDQMKKAIRVGIGSLELRFTMLGNELAEQVASIAFANIADLPDETLRGGDLRAAPKSLSAAIRSIKPTQHGYEIRMHDKLKALELLYKMIGEPPMEARGFDQSDKAQELEDQQTILNVLDPGRRLPPPKGSSNGHG